jgi:hypothetical protein
MASLGKNVRLYLKISKTKKVCGSGYLSSN